MGWADDPVRVRVPATSANLGPGFDTLGLALGLHDEVEARVTPAGLTIEVSGEGADDVLGAGEKHLVVRAMRVAFDDLNVAQPPGLALRCVNRIPHGRGLGSSAAAIVAGLVAARAVRLDPHPEVRPVAFIAPEPVSTKVARGLLPASVSHADAARNAGRAALLIAALTAHPDALIDGTEDK